MALFRFRGSKHALREPLGFSIVTIELTQSVGSETGVMIPSACTRRSSFSSLARSGIGTFRQASITGGIDGSVKM